jgi:hypothetical protein
MNQFTLLATVAAALLLSVTSASATSNYNYKQCEYITITRGMSPDKKWAIKAHGEGEDGYDKFHLYLVDVGSDKVIGPLTEIFETLDTGAEAFVATWSEDSTRLMITYRVDRQAPLKAIVYKLAKGRAFPESKKPLDVTDKRVSDTWIVHGSGYFNPDGTRKANADQPKK